MKKKLFIAGLLSMLMLSATVVSAADFSDIPSDHWANTYIETMTEKEVINGYPDGSFKPNAFVTRGEWASLLVKTAQIPMDQLLLYQLIDHGVGDVFSLEWHSYYLAAIEPYFDFECIHDPMEGPIIYFHAEQKATREELVKCIIRERGYDVDSADIGKLDDFTDADTISEESKPYIAIGLEKGIISGFEDNTLRLSENVTRAQTAAMLCRTYYSMN